MKTIRDPDEARWARMYESEMGLQRWEGWPHDEVDGRCRVSRLCSDGRYSHGDAEDGLGAFRTTSAVDEDYSMSFVWLEAGAAAL